MKKTRLSVLLLVVLFLVTVIRAQDAQSLTIFAASSLTNAFEEIAAAFKVDHPNTEILFNFTSSSDLAAQLAEGAPADIFASANNMQMTAALEAGRIAGTPRTFAKNRLVLITPSDNPANIATLRDLANPGIKIVIAAPDVPVRTYTDTMLERLAADAAYGDAYRTSVMANVVSEEQNVRQVAAKVALGEADAGIVYVSDVTSDIRDQVSTFQIPDTLNTIASYPIAITNDSPNPALAQEFIDFVFSDIGQNVLTAQNFISVTIPELPDTITLPTDPYTIAVEGQLLNPFILTPDDLKTNFPAQTVDVTIQFGQLAYPMSFTGVSLWQIINAGQPNLNVDVKNDKLSLFIVVTGRDGSQAVIAWGEMDPDFANLPILIAYKIEDGGMRPEDLEGMPRLIVPGDNDDGRFIRDVVNISLRKAPRVGK